MKKRVNAWPKTAHSINYKLFAEVFWELASVTSWEGYRSDAVPFPMKVAEMAHFAAAVSEGNTSKAVLEPIILEYNEALASDPILEQIFSEAKLSKSTFKLAPTDTTESIIRRSELVYKLVSPRYRIEAERKVIETCADPGGSRSDLINFTKHYVSYIVGFGFDRRFVSEAAEKHFYTSNIKRCDANLLRRFFKRFGTEEKKFHLFIRCNKELHEFLESRGLGEAVSWKKLPLAVRSNILGDQSSLVVRLPVTTASDEISAVLLAERKLLLLKSFRHFETMRRHYYSAPSMVVMEHSGSTARRVSLRLLHEQQAPILGRIPRRQREADIMDLLRNPAVVQSPSFDRVYYSLNAVALSLASDNDENRLVNCWAAFEALLPQPTRDERKVARISHFVDLIAPCVAFEYPQMTFQAMYRNCREQYGEPWRDFILQNGNGQSRAEQLASLVMGKNDKQPELCRMLSDSPLLLQRLWLLQSIYSDPATAKKRLERHERRVRWQLHRIYRQRNDIVHSGRSSSVTAGVIDNAHSYFYSILRLIERIVRVRKIGDAELAIELVCVLYRERMNQIIQLGERSKIDPEAKVGLLRAMLFSDVVPMPAPPPIP